MEFENFSGTNEQGKRAKDELKKVRVSDASHNAVHGKDALKGLSLGRLQEERERLVAAKQEIDRKTELNESFTYEQMRIRKKHKNRNCQESLEEWFIRRQELEAV